jgi:cytochrome o ubiquinol oxidase operon protein cyoD
MSRKSDHGHGSVQSYTLGFLLSLALTLSAYFAVVDHWFAGWILVSAIILLALTQFFVQVELFLHIGNELKPRWNAMALIFMILTVATIVLGSIWIMSNLNYNMMTSQQMDSYMRAQSKKGF